MTPTEDNYGMTSTTDYEPGTCCAGTVKILGESYRAMDDSNAPKCFQSGLQIVAIVSFFTGIAEVS